MTNAEAAAHFAALPPDQPAQVVYVNLDLGTAEAEELQPPDRLKDEIGQDWQDEAKGHPYIAQKW